MTDKAKKVEELKKMMHYWLCSPSKELEATFQTRTMMMIEMIVDVLDELYEKNVQLK